MRNTSVQMAGRGASRPAIVAILAAAIGGGLFVVAAGGNGEPARGPIATPIPGAVAPVDSTVRGIRFVSTTGAPEHLLVDTIPPTRPARLLFFQGQPAEPLPGGGVVTLDGAGGILRVDERLRVRRIAVHVEGRDVASVAGAPDGGLWVVTGDGEVLRLDARGEMLVHRPDVPFIYSLVATGGGQTAFLVRSPVRTGFRPVIGSTPLLARLGADGSVEATVGSGVVPPDFLLTHLASAGRIAITDSVIYYAPFIRDEVVALSMGGDTLWIAERNLAQAVAEPRFEVVDGDPAVDYAPVNLGIAVGPDDGLYVLSVPGFTTSQGRIDVFDRRTGDLVRSTLVDNPLPTLAADGDGRVFLLDEFRLLTGVPPAERATFQAFDLERLDGRGHLTSADVRGSVVLINFWASWCAPCRIEMPALDSLRASLPDEDFRFLSFNEDVRVQPARAFIEEYGFDFPVLLGKGDLRERYHYIGLPFTVLIDRDGKVVQRWIGYAGEEQLQAIRSVVLAELERGDARMDHDGHGDDGTMDHGGHTM